VLRTVLALLLDFADRELPGAINENAGWIVVKPRSLWDGADFGRSTAVECAVAVFRFVDLQG
jgi:hypothetical protein